jgi:hypothetical protein
MICHVILRNQSVADLANNQSFAKLQGSSKDKNLTNSVAVFALTLSYWLKLQLPALQLNGTILSLPPLE